MKDPPPHHLPKLKDFSDSSIFQGNRGAEYAFPPWLILDPVEGLWFLPHWVSKSDRGDAAPALRELLV